MRTIYFSILFSSFFLLSCSNTFETEQVVSTRSNCNLTLQYWNDLVANLPQSYSSSQIDYFNAKELPSGNLKLGLVVHSSGGYTISSTASGFIVEEELDGWKILPGGNNLPVSIDQAFASEVLGSESSGFIIEEDLDGWIISYETDDLCDPIDVSNFIVEEDLDGW